MRPSNVCAACLCRFAVDFTDGIGAFCRSETGGDIDVRLARLHVLQPTRHAISFAVLFENGTGLLKIKRGVRRKALRTDM